MAKADKPSEQPPPQEPSPFVPLAQVLDAQAKRTAPPPAPAPEAPAEHRAVISENVDGVVARAPQGVHRSLLGDIVHGNFTGSHEGRSWRVLDGTPASDLPRHIVRAILQSEPRAIGPFALPAAPTLV